VSLRDRLAAKERRRLVVPIQVSDPSEDNNTWMGVMAAREKAEYSLSKDSAEDDDEVRRERNAKVLEQLENQANAAQERVRSHYVDVELQALSRTDWEAATAKWTRDDEDGAMDWPAALAPLLAESCVDNDLQDEKWWRDTLAKEEWTEGDTDALRAALLQLNVYAVEARYPKGWAATTS